MQYSHLVPEWKEKYEAGASFRQLAKEYNISPGTVRRTLQGHVTTRTNTDYSVYAEEWKRLVLEEGWNRNEICKRYNVNFSAVTRTLSKAGVVLSERQYAHLSKEMAKMYEEGSSLTEIAEKYNLSRQNILDYLTDENVKIRDSSERNRVFTINEHYFDTIETEQQAYHLGIVFSIGTYSAVFQSYALTIAEKATKQYLIEEVLNAFYPDEKPAIAVDTDGIAKTRIYSRHLQETLSSYGLGLMTATTFPVNLDARWYPHFIAGYYAGKGNYTKPRKDLYFHGSKPFIAELGKVLATVVPEEQIFVRNSAWHSASLVVYYNQSISTLFEWLGLHTEAEQEALALKQF